MAGRGRRTRYQGVFARHRDACAVGQGGRCDCAPSYYGKVYDRASRRYVSTKRFATVTAAKAARQKLIELMESGELPQAAPTRLRDAHTRFIEAARQAARSTSTAAATRLRRSRTSTSAFESM